MSNQQNEARPKLLEYANTRSKAQNLDIMDDEGLHIVRVCVSVRVECSRLCQ